MVESVTKNKNTLECIQGKWKFENEDISITVSNTVWIVNSPTDDDYEMCSVQIYKAWNDVDSGNQNINGNCIRLIGENGIVSDEWEIDEITLGSLLITHSPSMNQFKLIRIEK